MHVIDRHIIIERLQKIKPELQEKYSLTELALFGSYARGDQHPASDIDILVDMDNISYSKLCRTVYELEDLFPGFKVQVVSKGGIRKPYFDG